MTCIVLYYYITVFEPELSGMWSNGPIGASLWVHPKGTINNNVTLETNLNWTWH